MGLSRPPLLVWFGLSIFHLHSACPIVDIINQTRTVATIWFPSSPSITDKKSHQTVVTDRCKWLYFKIIWCRLGAGVRSRLRLRLPLWFRYFIVGWRVKSDLTPTPHWETMGDDYGTNSLLANASKYHKQRCVLLKDSSLLSSSILLSLMIKLHLTCSNDWFRMGGYGGEASLSN